MESYKGWKIEGKGGYWYASRGKKNLKDKRLSQIKRTINGLVFEIRQTRAKHDIDVSNISADVAAFLESGGEIEIVEGYTHSYKNPACSGVDDRFHGGMRV